MYLSLNSKLRELERRGDSLKKVRDPAVHLRPGEGRLEYKGSRIEYLIDYVGESPDGSGENLREPHDIAWSPKTNTVIATALAGDRGPFEPLSEPLNVGSPVAVQDLARL